MILNGRTISSDAKKANAFMSYYAAVNKLKFSREKKSAIGNARLC